MKNEFSCLVKYLQEAFRIIEERTEKNEMNLE